MLYGAWPIPPLNIIAAKNLCVGRPKGPNIKVGRHGLVLDTVDLTFYQ